MVLYIQGIYEYGTLVLPRSALVKSKKQMTTISTPEAVEKQSKAMGTKAFEIGLFDPRAAQGVMLPRVWELETLLRSVSWLRLKNAEGRNIYIRPSGEHSLSLIDDATIQVIERLFLRLLRGTFKHGCTTDRFCRNVFPLLQHDCWRPALAVTLLRRIGGTTEDWRDLRIAKTNIERQMERFPTCGYMKPRERSIQKRSHFSRKSKPSMKRSNPSFRLLPFCGAGARADLISRASRIFVRSPSTAATRRAWISPMPSTLWPTGSRKMRRATRSLPVILRTKAIGNDNKSILIARLRRLGSESHTIGKGHDFLLKTQHSSRVAAGAVEGIEGHPKAFLCCTAGPLLLSDSHIASRRTSEPNGSPSNRPM